MSALFEAGRGAVPFTGGRSALGNDFALNAGDIFFDGPADIQLFHKDRAVGARHELLHPVVGDVGDGDREPDQQVGRQAE